MSAFKIIIRNSPGWRDHDACSFGVSVNSPNWQGEHFASILEFAAANFTAIRIDVTDALYRHNFMAEGKPAPEAMACAEALGALWLTQHQAIIDACAVNPSVMRWAHWYEHADYPNVLDVCRASYQVNETFRSAVEADIDGFFRRQARSPCAVERLHSRDYLIEEVAVMTLQARAWPGLRLYPGEELLCVNVVRHGLVSEAPRGLELEQFAKIRFHMRGHQAAAELCARAAPGAGVKPRRSAGVSVAKL
jgi:tRNA-dependent cyclodipeptide synthase